MTEENRRRSAIVRHPLNASHRFHQVRKQTSAPNPQTNCLLSAPERPIVALPLARHPNTKLLELCHRLELAAG